mgnify:CR=1 FL=1
MAPIKVPRACAKKGKMKYFALLFILPSVVSSMFIGAATSSLQIEGHNKGITIWDEFVYDYHYHPDSPQPSTPSANPYSSKPSSAYT